MAWAHLASGGAGGGMRWPNRHPHSLTPGMRQAQAVMADFATRIDWSHFAAENLSDSVSCDGEALCAYACGDPHQAVAWVIRGDGSSLDSHGHLAFRPMLSGATLNLPPMRPGHYDVTAMETLGGNVLGESHIRVEDGPVAVELPAFRHDVAVAIRQAN